MVGPTTNRPTFSRWTTKGSPRHVRPVPPCFRQNSGSFAGRPIHADSATLVRIDGPVTCLPDGFSAVRVAQIPSTPTKVFAVDYAECGGGMGSVSLPGMAANASAAAARLGAEVRDLGCIGDDALGARILADLATEGVDVLGLKRIARCRSSSAAILVDGAGERLICSYNEIAGQSEIGDRTYSAIGRPHPVQPIACGAPCHCGNQNGHDDGSEYLYGNGESRRSGRIDLVLVVHDGSPLAASEQRGPSPRAKSCSSALRKISQ